MNEVAVVEKSTDLTALHATNLEEYVTFKIGGQMFGISVLQVQDILKPFYENEELMGVTVEYQSELYTLLVDEIGEVLNLDPNTQDKVPGTMDEIWREFAESIFQLEDQLMIVLDVAKLLRTKDNN